jgi:SPP1 gp7 family putative phage head morphogenesis protein
VLLLPTEGRLDARRRARLPRQIPPRRLEEDYAGALVRIVRRVRGAWASVLRAVPELATAHATERGDARLDAGEHGKLRRLVSQAVESSRKAIQQPELDSLARKVAGRVGSYQKEQLTKQVRAAVGADPIIRDRGLVARVNEFTHENVALVSSIPERLHGELESIVTHAVSGGRLSGGRSGAETLRADIEERFGVAESRARLIARDQVGKFYAALNHARQKELGVERFVWRTVGDARVRDEHEELDGEVFSYDDPPVVEGEEALPGEQIQCRCWAEPILDDLLDDDDEPDDEPDDSDEWDE